MEKTEFVLEKSGDKVAEKIVNFGLNIQFDNGIVSFSGQKAVIGINGKEHLLPLDHNAYNIRLAELEQVTPNPNESVEAKSKREAKVTIYTKLIADLKKSTEKAAIDLHKLYSDAE